MFGGGGGMFGGGGGGFGVAAGGGGGARQFVQKFQVYPPSFMETDRPQVEEGDKIIMPTSCLEMLARLRISYPMLFEVTNELAGGRRTHCGVLEFIAPEGVIYLPHWMMSNLFLEPGDKVTIKSVSLPKGTFVKFRPQTKDFLDISNPKATLENKLRGFSALTTGDTIVIRHASKQYALDIMEVKPGDAMTIIETDVNVDFAPPLDHEEGLAGASAAAQKAEQQAAATAAAAPPPVEEMEDDGDQFAAFGGNGFSLSGKLAPSTGNGIVHTFGKIEKPIEKCKGGMSAPPTSSERPPGADDGDSSEEEMPYEGKRFHAFGGTGWR
jgi:ubiquitin fusion degradation protein 1